MATVTLTKAGEFTFSHIDLPHSASVSLNQGETKTVEIKYHNHVFESVTVSCAVSWY
jgi:hypothetical protein